MTRAKRQLLIAMTSCVVALSVAPPAWATKEELDRVNEDVLNAITILAQRLEKVKDKNSDGLAAGDLFFFDSHAFRQLGVRADEALAGMSRDDIERSMAPFRPKILAQTQKLKAECDRVRAIGIKISPDPLSLLGALGAQAGSSTPPPPAPGGMAFLLPTLLVLIVIGCVAFLYTEGIWSNAIRLINVVTAALIATNFWEPLARWLEGFGESFTYYWDLLALWGLFAISMLVFRSITSGLSKQKVKFLQIADDIGGGVLAAVVAWVMVCFITFTLHTAPLARNFMFGGFTPDSRMLMGLGPDRQWLGFARNVSRGVYCRYGNDDGRYGNEQDPSSSAQKLSVFDREGWFISRYAARRSALEKHIAEKGATRVDGGGVKR